MHKWKALALLALVVSTAAPAIEEPIKGCIDVLAGRNRIAEWIEGCAFPAIPDRDVLERVHERVIAVKRAGGTPVVVFDLDSTVYRTGPRALAALRQVLAQHAELFTEAQRKLVEGIDEFHWFSVPEAFEAIGISMTSPEGGGLWDRVAPKWFYRYRLEENVRLDDLYPGALRYVHRLHAAGATPAYVTGRQKNLMEASTLANLERDGFPPGPLFMKTPEFKEDIKFKDATTAAVKALGTVVGTFDNEPGNVVVFADAFPDAVNVFVDTVASDKAQPTRKGLWRIRAWE